MKKMMFNLMAVVISCMFLTGCGASTPMGTEQSVKYRVIVLAREDVRKLITPHVYIRMTGTPKWKFYASPSYADLKEKAELKQFGKIVTEIDKLTDKIGLSLSNIRTIWVNNKTKLSCSSADLFLNKVKVPIVYTAQLNSKDQVFVKIFGIYGNDHYSALEKEKYYSIE